MNHPKTVPELPGNQTPFSQGPPSEQSPLALPSAWKPLLAIPTFEELTPQPVPALCGSQHLHLHDPTAYPCDLRVTETQYQGHTIRALLQSGRNNYWVEYEVRSADKNEEPVHTLPPTHSLPDPVLDITYCRGPEKETVHLKVPVLEAEPCLKTLADELEKEARQAGIDESHFDDEIYNLGCPHPSSINNEGFYSQFLTLLEEHAYGSPILTALEIRKRIHDPVS